MQPMEMSNGADQDANRFYLLPLPAGLHPESPEMFGFFTYEFRVWALPLHRQSGMARRG